MSSRPPPAFGTPRRICAFARLWEPGLGDFFQRNIFLALLRRALPDAAVTHVVGSHVAARFAGFLAEHSYATAVLTCPDPGDDDRRRWEAFTAKIRSYEFDACVVDPDSRRLGARLAARCGIPTRIGFVTGTDEDAQLTVPIRIERPVFGRPDLFDYASGLAAALGLDPVRPADVVPPFRYRPEPVEVPPAPAVAIHPGGAKHWNRRWPFEHYVQLCGRLAADCGAGFVLLGSADEAGDLAELAGAIGAVAPGASVRVSSGESLHRLASLVAACDVLVGGDSAPAHLAAAVRTPSVVLYGPTMTEFMWTRVYPRHHGINRGYDCQRVRNIPRGAGATTMPCRYSCHYPYAGPAGPYPRCLSDIGVDEVVQAVTRVLGLTTRSNGARAVGAQP